MWSRWEGSCKSSCSRAFRVLFCAVVVAADSLKETHLVMMTPTQAEQEMKQHVRFSSSSPALPLFPSSGPDFSSQAGCCGLLLPCPPDTCWHVCVAPGRPSAGYSASTGTSLTHSTDALNMHAVFPLCQQFIFLQLKQSMSTVSSWGLNHSYMFVWLLCSRSCLVAVLRCVCVVTDREKLQSALRIYKVWVWCLED